MNARTNKKMKYQFKKEANNADTTNIYSTSKCFLVIV